MKITESHLRKIIRAQLKEFRLPEKELSISTNADIGKILDQALANKHASGRPFPSWLRNSINENLEIESMNEEALLKIVSELNKMKKNSTLFDMETLSYGIKKLDSPYLEVLKSILLFTGGNVETVRHPSKYRSSIAKETETFGDYTMNYGDVKNFIPTKSDYQIAKNVLSKLATAKNDKINMPIYRGIAIDSEKANLIKPGIKFNNWTLSSWTIDRSIAIDFAESDYDDDNTKILIQINNPQFGCYIGNLSAFQQEKEVIFGKKLKIIDVVNEKENSMKLECEVVS